MQIAQKLVENLKRRKSIVIIISALKRRRLDEMCERVHKQLHPLSTCNVRHSHKIREEQQQGSPAITVTGP